MDNYRSALVAALIVALAFTVAACNTAQPSTPDEESGVITDTLAAGTGSDLDAAEESDPEASDGAGSGAGTDSSVDPDGAGSGAGTDSNEDSGVPAAPEGSEVSGPVSLAMPPSWNMDPEAVTIDTQDLPYDWEAVLVPESPYDASQPPGPSGMPEHVEILFATTGEEDSGEPVAKMYIIPVSEYRAMWDESGDGTVAERITQIQDITYQLPSPPLKSGMPALPVEETVGANDLAVRSGRASSDESSASKDGYRFIGRFAQDANPVTNDGLRYVYQGFTNDGKYLVAGFFPISATSLPADAAAVTAEALAAFASDPAGQIAGVADELSTLPADDWVPARDTFNDMIGSLQIDGIHSNGLVGPSWEWTDVTFMDETNPVEDPEAYVIRYAPDGTVHMDSECRSLTTTYTAEGGLTGSMAAELKMSEPEKCEDPESRSYEFEAAGFIGTDYFVGAGGDTLGIQLAGGGPIHWFRLAE